MDSLISRVGSTDTVVPYEEPRDAKKMCSDKGYHRIESDTPLIGKTDTNLRLCYDCQTVFVKQEQAYAIVPQSS